jgi:intracellular multiplication protein IcmL
MPQDRLAIIAQNNQFYRNNFRRLLMFIFILLILAYALLGIIVYQHISRPIPQYFVTTSDGRLIEIKPLS